MVKLEDVDLSQKLSGSEGRKQLAAETENWERVSGIIGRVLELEPRR